MLIRPFCILLLFTCFLSSAIWETDLEKAKLQASSENKYILLNFSGSDWCGPCIKMRHDIFEDPSFLSLAEKSLVLVNADFPRQKKNQLSKTLRDQNNALADKYNPLGSFPLTLLLDNRGNELQRWDGYPKMTVSEFVATLKKTVHATN